MKTKQTLPIRFSLKCLRRVFFSHVKGKVLEIGPFNRPVVNNARYFDLYDKEGLIAVAELVGRDIVGIPEIDYVDPAGDLSVVDEKFNAVVSAHVIEHQPDLIRHLLQVSNLLDVGGVYCLAIPDKRFCFDYFFDASTPEQVFSAIGRTKHTWENILRHYTQTTHNNARKHWFGMHARHLSSHDIAERQASAKKAFDSGEYVDVHAWQFTPKSFIDLINAIGTKTGFFLDMVYETPPLHQEFMAILRKV